MDIDYTGSKRRMVSAGIAGLIVGFLAGWFWFGSNDEGDVDLPKDVESALDLEEAAGEDVDLSQILGGEEAGDTKKPGTPSARPASAVQTPAEGYKIFVTSQTAGNEVVIAQLVLKDAAWVVIHEVRTGKPANILGAKKYPAGSHIAASVKLQRPTVKGNAYTVMLHADDGASGFDPAGDAALTTENATPIMEEFTAN